MRKWTPVPRHVGLFSYDTQKGKRYGVRRGFKNADGKRDEFHPSGFTNWHDADRALKDFESTLAGGHLGPITHRAVTLTKQFESMKKRCLETGRWRESTAKGKTYLYNLRLKDAFGDRRLIDISRSDYQAFINKMVIDGYSHNTIKSANSLMQQIMNDAEHLDIIDKNRLKATSIKGGTAPRDVNITRDDFKTWMATAEQDLSRYDFCMVMLLTLGSRREEVLGLQLKSFVREIGPNDQPYYEINYYKARTAGDRIGGALKSDSAYRTNYAVTHTLVSLIDDAIEECKHRCTDNAHIPNPETFLYLTDKGTPQYISYINEQIFKVISLKTGITARPHMFRHYFATQAMQNGAAESTVMHWLGHSDIKMTASYTRPTKEGALALIKRLQDPLTPDK